MGMCSLTWACYALVAAALYIGFKYITQRIQQRKWDRWSNTPKDVVILHGFPKALTLPNASPFVMKLQTYLRMAKITHETDLSLMDRAGPKDKSPWISLNGQHMGDSQLIIEFLNKKFEKSIKGPYSEEQLAISTAVRVLLEERFFWGHALERFVYRGDILGKVTKINPLALKIIQFLGARRVKKVTWHQGLGRHSEEEVVQMMSNDLRVVSKILGKNKFFLGEEPCEDDCGIFGQLCEIVWASSGSRYEKLVNDELPNIKEYCYRMKERFYPDWEECLAK